MFMRTARDDSVLGTMRFVSRHADTQVYGAILPQAMTNQALLDSDAYKTYYEIASGAEPPMSRKSQKKSDSAISSEKSPSKKKSAKVKKVSTAKPKPTKKKALVKADRGKGLNVLSEVALSEADQLKDATKRSKKDYHISHASSSGDGTNFESGVPDEQHLKTTGVDEGTSTIPGVSDVSKYDYESEKESWGDIREEDRDDENESEDKSDDGKDNDDDANDDDDDDDDANDDDNQEGDDTNDDDEETDSDRTESDRIKIPILNQSTTEYYEEEEKIDDERSMKKKMMRSLRSCQQNVSQESGFEQVEEDAHVTLTPVLNTKKAYEHVQISSVSSDFTSKLLNLENPSSADNEIASLMETSARHATVIPEITSGFTKTIPPPPPFYNPLSQQATPTTSEATISFPYLSDFSSVFKFNDRVTNLEKDMSEIKQVDQQEAQDEKNAYIELVDTSIRAIIKEEVNTQLPQILPQTVSNFANLVIEKNVTESLEATVLTRSSSQLKSTYEVAASLSKFKLRKILLDKMEECKSHLRDDYKKKLYDALVESYNTDKDLFDTYGKVFSLKRSRDDSDKDRDPSARSDRGTKRRKSSKEAESSKDSSKSANAEEPSHTVDYSGVQQDQEFDTGNNDEQPADKEVSKDDCQVAHAKEPHTSFDELMDTSFDFFTFVLNRLNIKDLTQEILVGPTFEDLVRNLWSPVKVIYDKHAYWGTSHWGPKRQHFYGFAANMSLSKDVYSRKRIIAVTRLLIMKKYDYGHLEEIEVRREDQKLDKSNLRNRTTYIAYSDPKGVIYKDQMNINRLMRADELHKFSDGTLDDVRSTLNDIAKGIRMEYLPKRK
ncbi:hypothetical protein Tco_0316684 [Tanacetum coccineum]